MSYPRRSSPQTELFVCSTSSTDHQGGRSQVSLESFHPAGPPLLPLCSRLTPSASILSSSSILQRRQKKQWRKASSPTGSQGLEKVLHTSSHQYPKCGGGPREMAPKSQVVPHPICLTNLYTTITHSTGGTGAPTRRRLSTTFPNTHPPTPTSRPLDWYPLLPLPPTPMAVNDRTDHTCVLHWI